MQDGLSLAWIVLQSRRNKGLLARDLAKFSERAKLIGSALFTGCGVEACWLPWSLRPWVELDGWFN